VKEATGNKTPSEIAINNGEIMSYSSTDINEVINEAMRRPMTPGYGFGRIIFAFVTYQMFAGSVSEGAFGLWATLWGVSFAKDMFTGIAPMQTIWGAGFGAVCWLSWIVLFFA
jgi:hypothetical protein